MKKLIAVLFVCAVAWAWSQVAAGPVGVFSASGGSGGGSGTATHSVTLIIDGGGAALTATNGKMIPVLFSGTLTGYKMVCQPSGSITCDILRSAQGAGIPTASIV